MAPRKASATFAVSTATPTRAAATVRKPLAGGCEVFITFVNQDGKPVVHSIDVRPTGETPRGGLTTRLLRGIPLGELLAQAQREVPELLEEHFRFLERPRRAGRPRTLSDLDLARLAVAYEDACAQQPSKPRVLLAAQRGETPERVRDLVHEARRRALLEPALHGKAGGRATAKARVLIDEAETRGGTSDPSEVTN